MLNNFLRLGVLILISHDFELATSFVVVPSNGGNRISEQVDYNPGKGRDEEYRRSKIKASLSRLFDSSLSSELKNDLSGLAKDVETSLNDCRKDIVKTCRVAVRPTDDDGDDLRLGLFAKEKINKGDVILSIPLDNPQHTVLTPKLAREIVLVDHLPSDFDSWTGDLGLIALLILTQLAQACQNNNGLKVPPGRSDAVQTFLNSWVKALPSPSEFSHPFLWNENDQEILQMSSTKKIYRILDDIEDDAAWWTDMIWSKNRHIFPETVDWNGQQVDCFNARGFMWAMAMANSRCTFLDSTLCLVPYLDFCNHNDQAKEIDASSLGPAIMSKNMGAVLVAHRSYQPGEQVFCSYGPKSAAEYILQHGFFPPKASKTAVAELSFELDSENDPFYDDKLDILEYETSSERDVPMDPMQSFDVISEPRGRDGEPDPAMIQFLRLVHLGSQDAFLLESVFRKDVWNFMAEPVSEVNEGAVIDAVLKSCRAALDEMDQCPTTTDDNESGPAMLCKQLRESERLALRRTAEYLEKDQGALDLKEYYQERRLKDLGLDSEWNPDEEPGEGKKFEWK